MRLFNEPHDAREGGPIAGCGNFDPKRAGAVDRAGNDFVAFSLLHRARLPGDHRLVHRTRTLHHHTVSGDSLAGAHQDDVALPQLIERDLLISVSHDPDRSARKELRQLLEGSLRLRNGTHLDPVAQQHDRHERGELLPQRHAGEPERHDRAENKRDRDREGDERHHAGQAILQLADGSLDEDPAAVDEHGRAEDRRDPFGAGDVRRRVAERALEHVSPDECRDREQE